MKSLSGILSLAKEKKEKSRRVWRLQSEDVRLPKERENEGGHNSISSLIRVNHSYKSEDDPKCSNPRRLTIGNV